jgi:hemolysin activation/secretion protein
VKPATLLAALLTVATPAQEPEANPLLPEPGALPEATDPWADWEPEAAPLPLDLARPAFDLPPAASLFPARAIELPLLRIREIRFVGNRKFDSATLSNLVPWLLEEPADLEDLDAARDAITRHYIAAGFVNSGAVVDHAASKDGVLVLTITEGSLTDVEPTGNHRLRDRYLASRIQGANGESLHFPTLQKRLQVLQMNPNLSRIQAELRPGPVPGESYLDLAVEETSPWSYGLDLHNHLPPSVGSEQLDLWLQSRNLTGWSDSLDFRYGVFAGGSSDTEWSGLDSLQARYLFPLNRHDTLLELTADRQGYAVIEEPFAELGIEGESQSTGIGLRHPLLRTLEDEAWLSLSLVQKHAETELLGVPFSVSPGFVNGELDLTTLRGGIDWTRRTSSSVLFLSSRLVLGLDALGATESLAAADSSYFLWTASGQYMKRLNRHDHTLAVRATWQWADDSLPSPEQAALGGSQTVRGYRENELVRDIGGSLGIEYRIPLLDEELWKITAVPFVDAGLGWDHDGLREDHLISAGLGFTASYRDWFRAELFWGHAFHNAPAKQDNLQDHGIHFRLSAGRF